VIAWILMKDLVSVYVLTLSRQGFICMVVCVEKLQRS
jgi:hypothetical protein